MRKWLVLFLLLWTVGLVSCTSPIPEEENPDIPNLPEEPDEPEEPEPPLPTAEERVEELLDSLSIEQKVGQLFMVGMQGTAMDTSLRNAINNYYFGNFIYFGYNVADDSLVADLSEAIQEEVVTATGIPGLISMDQEGGMVVRFAGEATHFIGNMGLAATANSENAYWAGKFAGEELRHFGVNVNLAPVLDVNNNPDNPIIGIRSYGDQASTVSEYGLEMIAGLSASKVMATAKHFPGHGDTTVDSHYGLPMIPHAMDRLNEVELAPFRAAIAQGVDAIMTAHIIFSALDSTLPATLSHAVVTGLLRNELEFDGIIMTDEMRMNAIRNNFGVEEAAVLALQAGVDILLYAESSSTSITAYQGVLQAIADEVISEERIDESVRRILLKKIKMGLMEEYLPKRNMTAADFAAHQAFNDSLIRASITQAKGSIDQFSQDNSTLFISTLCTRYPLLPNATINTATNSFAYVGKTYFQEKGMDAAYREIGTSLSSSQIQSLVQAAANYEQIVIGVENMSSSQAQLVTALLSNHPDLILVAFKNPYDITKVPTVNHYICTYGYFAGSVHTLLQYLTGEVSISGVLPVAVTGLS